MRQGRHARDKGEKNLERGRVKLTGTPTLGLPPVPSGDAAFSLVRGVLQIGAHDIARCSVMGIIIATHEANNRRDGVGPKRAARRGSRGHGLTAYRRTRAVPGYLSYWL